MTVRFELLAAGYCRHPQRVILRRGWRIMTFPSMFGLIEHPKAGVILYDTGYAEHFHAATRPFPERLYAWATPMHLDPGEAAVAQCAARGIKPEDVRLIILSHLHGDHIAGLRDFPQARFALLPEAWAAIQGLSRLNTARRGVLPGLLPEDFAARLQPLLPSAARALPPECAPFTQGFDLFGDDLLWLVALPGHAPGQVGLFVRAEDGLKFLIADAAWHSASYREGIMPHPLVRWLFPDARAYEATLLKIQAHARWRPETLIIPSHCEDLCQARVWGEARP
ncbi:MBL fold metallo-hydrolase [Myxococcota bacterium]|nr:MBL fold metallo-hydrolase [Myxococcota bacterium]MBU1430324.1 MBL fold metallo-hydrolase [Myxococcota bacterium]MBU1900592.1 MBL fold metallo-hydrolase [Myxococcota bacterium]